MPKAGKPTNTNAQKKKDTKKSKKEKDTKKPSKVAQTRQELTKQAENIDSNLHALKQLGLIGSGATFDNGIDMTNMTKKEKKKVMMKKKRAKGTPK